jgi:hypothetical protein
MEEDAAVPIGISEALTIVQGGETRDPDIGKIEATLDFDALRVMSILEEHRELRKMRLQWSRWILGCIVAIVVFDFLLITAAGFNIVRYENSYIIPAFLGESIINIIGLAVVIVKFLFSDHNLSTKDGAH